MKTTHQIAEELLQLPDVQLHIEGWCLLDNQEICAVMSEYDPEGTAFLIPQ